MAKAVIMAGGQGERFWPLTHKKFPKYRIQFEGKKSLLQNTYDRLSRIYGPKNIWVVTTSEHVPFIKAELPGLEKNFIIEEPFRNNTCAAIYLACQKIKNTCANDETVSFFPADHLIKNEALFKKTMLQAIQIASKTEHIVTIGISPTFPATGYGYIEKGQIFSKGSAAFKVKRFVEKPDRVKAKKYLVSKKFYWNGGMFTWRLSTFQSAIQKHCPEFVKNFDLKKLEESYKKLPSISIDYALMEKAKNIAVLPASMDWCDMGSWEMLQEKSPKDARGVYAEGIFYYQETKDSLIVNQTSTPLIVLGLSGIVAVQTPRGTLICPKGRSEEAALLAKKL